MALSCIILELEILVDNHDFFHTPCFRRPVRGLRQNTATPFGVEKLEWCG